MKSIMITAEYLRTLNACRDGLTWFEYNFPHGVELTDDAKHNEEVLTPVHEYDSALFLNMAEWLVNTVGDIGMLDGCSEPDCWYCRENKLLPLTLENVSIALAKFVSTLTL